MKVTIDHKLSIEYQSVGQGPVIVLLHAFPLSSEMWQPQLDALKNQFRVIAPNIRGFGDSSSFEGEPSVDQAAEDIGRLLDALKITEPVVLGGLSMGGYVTLAASRKIPQRFKGFILADTKAEPDDETGKTNRNKLIQFSQNRKGDEIIDTLLPKMVAPSTMVSNKSVVDKVRQIAAAQKTASIIDALKLLRDRPDSTPGLGNIQVPTLIIVGTEDALTPPSVAQNLKNGIKKSQLVEIPGAGHLANLEKPDLFNQAIVSFMAGL